MLDGFFVIEFWRLDAGSLVVCLVPDHFSDELADPVVTVRITELQDPEACEAALLKRKGELIVALEVSEGLAAIYAEYDDEPASLRGATVSVTRGPYSFEHLRGIIQHKEQELRRCYEQLQVCRSTIDSTESFVCELIRRAEIKRELSSRDTASLDLEVTVLQRVLRRIRAR
jgi:hypothetical protein